MSTVEERDAGRIRNAVRQELLTARLMGVPFLPVVFTSPPVADPSPGTESIAGFGRRERTADDATVAAGAAKDPVDPTTVDGVLDVDAHANQTNEVTPRATAQDDKADALAALRAEHDARCPLCTVVTGITQTVFGEGNPDADIMFVGEAPGAEEDRTGRPFVGRAGQKLDGMINAMGRQRGEVFIANILKSRPPNNRTPLANEIAACAPFLTEQIRIIDPRVIVALGGPATKFLLHTDIGITRLRGQWARYEDGGVSVDLMPTFHPAYLLRNYTRETRERVWSDLQAVMTRLGDRLGVG